MLLAPSPVSRPVLSARRTAPPGNLGHVFLNVTRRCLRESESSRPLRPWSFRSIRRNKPGFRGSGISRSSAPSGMSSWEVAARREVPISTVESSAGYFAPGHRSCRFPSTPSATGMRHLVTRVLLPNQIQDRHLYMQRGCNSPGLVLPPHYDDGHVRHGGPEYWDAEAASGTTAGMPVELSAAPVTGCQDREPHDGGCPSPRFLGSSHIRPPEGDLDAVGPQAL
jgi:hypothetical protein